MHSITKSNIVFDMNDNIKAKKKQTINNFQPQYDNSTPYERKMRELSNDKNNQRPNSKLNSLRGVFNSEMRE